MSSAECNLADFYCTNSLCYVPNLMDPKSSLPHVYRHDLLSSVFGKTEEAEERLNKYASLFTTVFVIFKSE